MYHNSYSILSLKLYKISIEHNLSVIANELNVEASKKNDCLQGRFYFCIYLGISYALWISILQFYLNYSTNLLKSPKGQSLITINLTF